VKTPQEIAQALIAFGDTLPSDALSATLIPEVAELVTTDPYAFMIAVCLERGMPAEFVWTIPYHIQQELGHLDPAVIYGMSLEELAGLFSRLPRRPRYVNDAPRTLKELTQIVVEKCEGDAANIWAGKRAAEIKRTLLSIYGVGVGIANMGVLLIEAIFGITFDELDRRFMDIKPDVHTRRVLYRLGMIEEETEQAALDATRMMNPDYPGALDGALWSIGREWCFASNPDCENCPMDAHCAQIVI
jgi:endonuclease-3